MSGGPITRSLPARRVLVTGADGFLVVTDQFYPGWAATVNGTPTTVLRANVAFRALRLPAGESTVEFRYRPLSIRLGVAGVGDQTNGQPGLVEETDERNATTEIPPDTQPVGMTRQDAVDREHATPDEADHRCHHRRDPYVDARDQGGHRDDECVRQHQKGVRRGLANLGRCTRGKRSIRREGHGHEQQPDQGPGDAGGSGEEGGETIGDHSGLLRHRQRDHRFGMMDRLAHIGRPDAVDVLLGEIGQPHGFGGQPL